MKDKQEERKELYDTKNEAPFESFSPSLLDAMFFKCQTHYMIYNNRPFTRIEHKKPCEKAKEHFSFLNEEDHIALRTIWESRSNSSFRKEGPVFQAKDLRPSEAASVVEEFQDRFGKK